MVRLFSSSAYRSVIFAFLFVPLLLGTGMTIHPVHAATGDGSPADANIRYFGRWDTSSSSVYTAYWGGSYFKTAFTGTTVQIKLGGSTTFFALIDNGPDRLYSNVSGTVNLTPVPLGSGTHTLRVALFSEWITLPFEGLIMDAGATTVAPTTSSTIIEFTGDSITAGYDDTRHALSDYAWLTSEQLHAEHTQIAYSGICLVDNVKCYSPNSIGMSRQFFKLQTVDYPDSPDWDFSRYQAAAVVINLGTNDNSNNVTASTFQSTYITFLQNIRTKYPNAQIFALRTFGGYMQAPTQAAVQAVNSSGDANVHYIDTTGWLSSADYVDGVHPSDDGQQKVANQLAPVLASYLGRGYSHTTAIDDSVQGSGVNQMNYAGSGWQHCTGGCGGDTSGLYDGSNSWDNTGNDTVSVTFSGVQLKLYGVVDAINGIGAVSLDGGSETTVDFYAATRAGDQLLWISPLLPVGTHTFTLRVTGNKNPASSNTYVVPDRVDVISSVILSNTAYYKVMNVYSGKVMDVAGASTADGAKVIQWSDHNGTNQQWQFVDVGNGYYKLVSRNSGKVLDVSNFSTTAGTQLQQWTDNGGSNQQWSLIWGSDNTYVIVSRSSGMVADDSGAATADGTPVIQWPSTGNANQKWVLIQTQ